jgi:hypothetical protein
MIIFADNLGLGLLLWVRDQVRGPFTQQINHLVSDGDKRILSVVEKAACIVTDSVWI